MSKILSKAVVFAIAVVFAAAPFVFAQTQTPGSGSATSGTQQQTQQHMSPGTTPSSQSSPMGTMGAQDTIHATVADVNHQHNTLKLKMQSGETVEFKVPEASLTHLNKGDSVQVSIRKAEAQSGMTTQPARPAPSTSAPSTSAPSTSAPSTSGSTTPAR